MDKYHIDTAIIGAGVVGMAVAAKLAVSGRRVFVLERHDSFGMETSSRNSEVIHAGIYYPDHSLKARLCVAGKQQLYAYCERRGVPFRRCGKLIVATAQDQLPKLAEIFDQGHRNGVVDLERWAATQVKGRFPGLVAQEALWSPSTGIIDSHALMRALQEDAAAGQAEFLFKHEVLRGNFYPNVMDLEVRGPDGVVFLLSCKEVINCGGLQALTWVTRSSGIFLDDLPAPCYAKGNYFTLAGRAPFDALVYPVPEPGGLGVHLTLDLAGQARFGPDVEWVDQPDYQVSDASLEKFYAEVRKYWPALPDHALQAGYCGIRPKLMREGVLLNDFVIQQESDQGLPGFINLLGIESPGLTCCLALADEVVARL